MPQRLIALATSALLIGGLFVGAPAPVRAVTNTVYVADVIDYEYAGGSCDSPDYTTNLTEDAATIQDAIDAVDTSPSLTTVYLCAGTYNITATLEPTEDITFIGAGAATTILDGGAIYTGGNYVSGGVSILFSLDSVTVEGLTFQHGANNLTYDVGNYATWGGGAINSYTVTVIDSTFTQNKADSYGGAIWTFGPSTIQGDSVFTENIATFGGAIYNYSGEDLTIQGNSVFTGNEAYNGGAIFSWGHTRVTNGTFLNNESECNGGAIAANNDVTVTSSTFTGNVTNCNGGAIRASKDGPAGNVYATSSTFTSNASGSVGGAISSDSATVGSSTFS
jgi:predicted outer membrane repeat protein